MKYFGWLMLILCAVQLPAQKAPLPRKTGLLIGTFQCFDRSGFPSTGSGTGTNSTTTSKIPTLAVERTLLRHASMQFGIGLDFLTHPKNPIHRKWDTQFFTEFRYYILLRRGGPLSGFYCGLYLDITRERWIYRAENQLAIRRTFENIGPSIGYQHAIGKHLRFNEGVTAVHHSVTREDHFTPTGDFSNNYRLAYKWFSAYWYVKIGVVF